jgi:predicted DNA-binding antitoxin AbrB/MazE fold protein
MSITIDVTYEDGVLKPASPLPFKEHEMLRVTLVPKRELAQPETKNRSASRWRPLIDCDDAELIQKAALDPELAF